MNKISYSKSASLPGATLTLSLADGRISLYRWHDDDYESVGFVGNCDDYERFDDVNPEKWFDIAFGMIEGRIGL
jgi:hypothetical protein